ncbi:MAG TPA: hypothetical protein PKH05_17940 [Nitrospira sp.]|jgi:hypothetical protein|nr:hypothetical protein [Nitrospira sp.]
MGKAPYIPGWDTAALVREYAIKLARVIYERERLGLPNLEPDARLKEIRDLLLKEAEDSEMCRNVVQGMDHLHRVLFHMRQSSLFSVSFCAGKQVDYYRVVIVEDGEIRHDSGKLKNPNQATELANRWFYLLAPSEWTVVLMATLASGQIIKCGERRVPG